MGPLRPLGVYIHYPFCRKLCPYCDFAVSVVSSRGRPDAAYADAVIAELGERAGEIEGRTLATIYLGGGTPSLWSPAEIGRVVTAVRAAVPGTPAEVTLEANPRDCTAELMMAWRRAGVDRLSIGVQAFAPATLSTLGRDHSQGDGRAALEAALDAGFAGVSADFILGVPGSPAGLDDILAAVELGVAHLSIYELTIEARTHFGKRVRAGTLPVLGDDELADRYLAVHEALVARGFVHYEVSSYARPGAEAVHNAGYWQGREYLGLGAGAASYRRTADGGAVRRTNLRPAYGYLRARGDARAAEVEAISADAAATDELWLGMRAHSGVTEAAFSGRSRVLERLLGAGLAVRDRGRIRPTIRGFLFHDQVAGAIVGGAG